MGVRGRLLRDLLSSLKIIKNLSEQQIKASLWRGEGMLYNIEFDPGHLQELLVEVCPVGLEILSVHVDELYAKIPWSQLGTQSVLIVAKSVTVNFELHCEGEEEWREVVGPLLRRERQKKQRALYAAPGSLTDPQGTLNQLRQRMLHSLQLRADKIRVSISSRHRRHFSNLRTSDPEGAEEALVVEFHDVTLSPCDAEHNPSDQMKQMAVYEPQDRVLQLTRLLKCRAFTVIPPQGGNPCPYAEKEFMETPAVLQCSIVDRSTSDGNRICPVLLSTHLLFDIPGQLRIRCSECQLCAFLALVSDVAQMEEWRLDEALVCGRQPEVLMDTSDVARTFAQGPAARAKPRPPAKNQSLIRATSAFGVSSSFFSSSSTASSSGGKARMDSSPNATDKRAAIAAELALEASPDASSSLSVASEAMEEEEEDAEEDHSDDETLFLDADELDYFSVASENSPSSAGETPKNSDWLHKMRAWFRSAPSKDQGDQSTSVDLSTQRTRLALSICTLLLQVAVQCGADGGYEFLSYEGEQVSFCVDTRFEFTEAQRECVKRFAYPSEDRPSPLWPWQLHKRIGASQRLEFQRFSLDFGGAELLRGLAKSGKEEGEAMMKLLIRPRGAPAEVLVGSAGELSNWPSSLRLTNCLLALENAAIVAMVELYKRVKPNLAGKVPPPELLAPENARQPGKLFPSQCLQVEFNDCEFVEPGDASIQKEQRWPWRGFVPHLVLRSDSSLWDLAGALSEGCGSSGGLGDRRSREALQAPQEGMVAIPQEMFDELVRRSAETTRKDAEVSAAREELQRAYITLATSRPHAAGSPPARAQPAAGGGESDGDQDELDRLRQKCLQLELSLQSQALAQRRLETELAHHQARAQEEMRRLLVVGRGRSA